MHHSYGFITFSKKHNIIVLNWLILTNEASKMITLINHRSFFLNDLLWVGEYTDVCNLADDTTLYGSNMDLSELLRQLEHDSHLAIEWFESNYMKLNKDKCHLLLAGHKHEYISANIGGNRIGESLQERLLGDYYR